MRAYSSMPRHQDCEFIRRTAFTNQLNLSKTNNREQSEPTDNTEDSPTPPTNNKESNDEVINTDGTLEKSFADDTADEDNPASMPVTDESSIGSPSIDKRTISESTSIDQSSVGSPVLENMFLHDSPAVSSCESPLVEKRTSESVVDASTGAVFRKVTLKKRRVDTRNLPPGQWICVVLCMALDVCLLVSERIRLYMHIM